MITHNITIYPNGGTNDELLVRQWDNLSHRLAFTLPPQVAQASGITAELRVLPNGAKAPYVYPCEINGMEAACTPTYEAWGWQGTGHVQLAVYSGENVLWQTARIPVTVQGSIDAVGALTPEEGKTLVQQLQEVLNEAAGIIDFEVEAVALPAGSDPTAERVVDPGTGKTIIVLGLVDGSPGAPGKGLEILGYYADVYTLELSVNAPEPGDAYGVGATAPYEIYVWDGVAQEWRNNGYLQGVQGATFTPTVSEDGIISWSNDGGLTNPEPVNIRGQGAYEAAQAGGYAGTESDFYADLAAIDGMAAWFAAY